MHFNAIRYVRRFGHLFVLWTLLVAVPIYGGSGVLLQIVGPVHRHLVAPDAAAQPAAASPASQGLAWLVGQWRAWQRFAHDRGHSGALVVDAHAHRHNHQHDGFERHHHGPDDDMVVLGPQEAGSGGSADLNATASAGGAALVLALAASLKVPLPLAGKRRWRRTGPALWRSADPRRRDRPPAGRDPRR